MMRQAAFWGGGKLLKGALHCHTTRSDGAGSPEEVMRKHAENGYDFMAITDHRIYNHKSFAEDTGIIIVPGMEMDRSFYASDGVHCFHTVSIGPSIEGGNGYEQDQVFESGLVVDQFEFQKVLDELHKNKNMTIYCHPEWSGTPARDFDRLIGNFAMEIWNSGCALENELDMNAAYWDELLYQNQRIYGVAVDDGHAMYQHCLGWVMVNSKPELSSILEALRGGAFYSSCGPVIEDFYYDDGAIYVRCSPCESISFHYLHRPTIIRRNPEGLITEARLEIEGFFRYIRATVRDSQGRRAWTNPIFLK